MSVKLSFTALMLILLCLLLGGCGIGKQIGTTLGALAEVRGEIIKRFGDDGVNINLNKLNNRTTISVTFINSPLNDSSQEERRKRAEATAEIVKDHYPAIKSVNLIWVGFIRVITLYLVVHWTEGVEGFRFDNEGRALPSFDRNRGIAPEVALQTTANYLSDQNQTDIVVSGLQLQGVPGGEGVTLLPHFFVSGDTNKVTPRAPAVVNFDFASYSAKQKFPGVTKIAFLVNRRIAYETEGQFTTSKLGEGTVNEFLYLKVPYAKFRQINAGPALTLRLGEEEYQLTSQQLKALQEMSSFVKQESESESGTNN
jgi:hypothetical protein